MSNEAFDAVFGAVLVTTPAVALFIGWLMSNHEPASVAAGTWCGLGAVVVFLLLLVRQR